MDSRAPWDNHLEKVTKYPNQPTPAKKDWSFINLNLWMQFGIHYLFVLIVSID
jgi:hypothetical protein